VVFSILFTEQVKSTNVVSSDYFNVAGVLFIVALMGWMPSIVDISVWHSLWSIERKNQTGHHPTLKEARFDFNLGYIGTTFLAFAFLSLGALVMSGTGKSFSNSSVAFAGQLVALYTNILGSWAGPIISVAAFITMFSTTLTVTDAYPRVIKSASDLIFPDAKSSKLGSHVYFLSMIILSLIALGIISFLMSGIKSLIDVATTMSFLTTPVLVFINYRVVISHRMPEEARPGLGMRILSWAGIAFWTIFAIFFLFVKLWHEV
jgi:Mn2+/Fe2+ NRAMP family transporter